MPTVFIANTAVLLPSRFAPGTIADATAAAVLNDIQHRRIKAKLRYLLAKGDILTWELQSKAEELLEQDLVPYLTLDDDDEGNDPVMVEAISMARELILSRMAQEGLPPPKGIDDHAKALVNGQPALLEMARNRVEERYRAASAAMEEIT